jgi:hypothetical protein
MHFMIIYVALIFGGVWTPLPLFQLVHGCDELISTLITPFVITEMGKNMASTKSKKLSLMVYLYFARKVFCSLKPFWSILGMDSQILSAPQFVAMEQMASGREMIAGTYHRPEFDVQHRC